MPRIFYREVGVGFPVVFLHGYGETGRVWENFENHLRADYHLFMPDLPGFGRSKPIANESFSIDDVAEEIHHWLQRHCIQRCVMIGHSLGGYVTLAFAEKYGTLLDGMGLFHSNAFADSSEKKQNRNKTAEFITKNGLEKFSENFVPGLFANPEHHQTAVQHVKDMMAETTAGQCAAYMNAMRDRPNRTQILENFEKPAFFIYGKKDSAVDPQTSQKHESFFKPERILALEEAGHMGMYEATATVTSFLNGFLDSLVIQSP